MKKHSLYFKLAVVVSFFITSCVNDELDRDFSQDNDFIKAELAGSKIVSNYKYNTIGKIEEKEGAYFYSRYLYDNEGKLIKIETAVDPLLYSNTRPIEKTALMTAENSTISSHQNFEYDGNGSLLEIENYFKEEGDFELRSKLSFEFVNGKIVKRNLHDKKGEITQFNAYEYDQNGNVSNEKYFTYLFSEGTAPRLMSETSFKYDNKKNPFVIFKDLGNPGIYTNPNNAIETSTIRHEETPGFDESTISSTFYEYSPNDYPIKVMTENSEYAYRY